MSRGAALLGALALASGCARGALVGGSDGSTGQQDGTPPDGQGQADAGGADSKLGEVATDTPIDARGDTGVDRVVDPTVDAAVDRAIDAAVDRVVDAAVDPIVDAPAGSDFSGDLGGPMACSGGCVCGGHCTCTVGGGGGCGLKCGAGKTCILECTSGCSLTCEAGAMCIMKCPGGPGSCAYSCPGGSVTVCPDQSRVCRMPCP